MTCRLVQLRASLGLVMTQHDVGLFHLQIYFRIPNQYPDKTPNRIFMLPAECLTIVTMGSDSHTTNDPQLTPHVRALEKQL
jgi:hypothetical protein